MHKSRTLSIQIRRPIEEIYIYLANPANLSGWTMVEGGRPAPEAGALVWTFTGPRGSAQVHFTPPNAHFILDYDVRMDGRIVQAGYVRLIRNGDGTELVHTSIQQEGIADAVFDSEAEWILNDLLVLKTLLEAR